MYLLFGHFVFSHLSGATNGALISHDLNEYQDSPICAAMRIARHAQDRLDFNHCV